VAFRELIESVSAEVGRVVIGQREMVEGLLTGLAIRGHVLLEGPPGVAKTLTAASVARTLGVRFTRVQFTPDMLPSDLTGTMTLRGGELRFRPGPVFTNVLLADEVNRTPPKTQASLLEAMQERQVSVEGEPRPLEDPFIVIATQNPIEYEGTYPLPEAQLDRFAMRIEVGYPSAEEEAQVLAGVRTGIEPMSAAELRPVVSAADIEAARTEVDATTIAEEVMGYVVAVVRRTRELPSVSLGASPRAAVHLAVAAKAAARAAGRDFVTPDDVAARAEPVLAHRLLLSPEAALEGFGPSEAVHSALAAVAVPR
jgi:MoxR-like ATPase